jgi:L-seryl-tRNA(Ser) seleniumtransferase
LLPYIQGGYWQEKQRASEMTEKPNIFKPPQVDKVLRDAILAPWHKRLAPQVITQVVRNILDSKRAAFLAGDDVLGGALSTSEVANLAVNQLEELSQKHLSSVINGTGIIINTNLGRAPLPASALESTLKTLASYCDLEVDLADGKRGERTSNIENLFKYITGCQAALVVNNNAASVMLAIMALAQNRDVIVSRGELLEIGGSFRLPEVILAAQGRLCEVGTTNRTRAQDYEKAISHETGMLFKCHRSNFEMTGFVEEASAKELLPLAQAKGIPLVEDLGSGCLVDLEKFGLQHERTVHDCLNDGANLVLFSADKLLGGPQAGIILGDKKLIETLRRHPIYRALRADKMLISLLEAVLTEYLSANPEDLVPVLKMAKQSPEAIQKRVEEFMQSLRASCPKLSMEILQTESAFGGGTSPNQVQRSFAIKIKVKGQAASSINELNRLLRNGTPKVIARLQDESIIIDFRTVQPWEEEGLAQALLAVENSLAQSG